MIYRLFIYVFKPKYSSWQPPMLRDPTSETAERKATWLELFFDVGFVAAIAELSGLLSSQSSPLALPAYVLLYTPVWWLWIGMTFYNDRFDRGTKMDRLFTFAMMIPLAGLAVSIHNGITNYPMNFVVWYIAGRLLLIFLWTRAGVFNPRTRPLVKSYVIGFSIAVLVWLCSMFSFGLWQIAFWILALLIELVTPLFTLRFQQDHLPALNHSHLTERFGLFTIIVLAEIFLGVLHGVSALDSITWYTMSLALLGLLVAFGFWSIYFDEVIAHPRMPQMPWNVVWVYMHLPLTFSITAIGAGLVRILSLSTEPIDVFTRFMLCTAVAMALVSIAIIEYAHEKGVDHTEHTHTHDSDTSIRLLGALLAMCVSLFTTIESPLLILGLLVTIIVHQVWHSLVHKNKGCTF